MYIYIYVYIHAHIASTVRCCDEDWTGVPSRFI